MKKSTLALAFGAGLATAVMGTISPASALTVGGPGGTGTVVVGPPPSGIGVVRKDYNAGATPAYYISSDLVRGVDYTLPTATIPSFYTYSVASVANNSSLPWKTFEIEYPTTAFSLGAISGGVWDTPDTSIPGKIVLKPQAPSVTFPNAGGTFSYALTFSVLPGAPATASIKQYATPEPLTILGTGVVLGAIPALKKEYAKRAKKKSGDA